MKLLSASVRAPFRASLCASALALATFTPAWAATTVLDFEKTASFESISDYYNGASGGPAWGVSFGPDAIGLKNDSLGPYFSNAPSPLGVMTPVGSIAWMNVAAGFVGNVSFAYSSPIAIQQAVQVWSGLNGSGNLLASFNLAANAKSGGCSSSPLCNFNNLSASFSGIARSMTFGNAANAAAFDNVAITAVPEPASALLLTLGLSGMLLSRRRNNSRKQ